MSARKKAVPNYRLHKPTGQAVVTVRTPAGGRRNIYLGKYNSPESRSAYNRVIAELEAAPAAATLPISGRAGLTIVEAMLAFAKHATEHYAGPDGKITRELTEYRQAIRIIRDLYGSTPAREFGPLALKAVRQKMIESGLCRPVVNRRVARVRRIFKWLASEELVPATVFQSLTTVAGLQKGKTVAPEPEPVVPVADHVVRLTLPWLTPTVAGLIRLLTFTGMRPGEACRIRPADIDTSGDLWLYKPPTHKNSWRGKPRVIVIGKRGQEVLREFQPTEPTDYHFSPKRSVEAFHAARAAARKTPKFPSHLRRNSKKRQRSPSRAPAEKYTTQSLGRAIAKAVERSNAHAAVHFADCGPNLPTLEQWAPNQIRHSHATEVRKRFGVEAAGAALGHSRMSATEIYAERDLGLAQKVADELG